MGVNEQRTNLEHEETIEPIRPAFVAEPSRDTGAAPRLPELRAAKRGGVAVVGVALAAALLVVFVGLPRWLAGDGEAPGAAPGPIEETEAEVPSESTAMTREESAALEAAVQSDLARLLTQQSALEDLSAASWGGADWQTYEELSRSGDDAYLLKDFTTAASSYSRALTLGETLIERAHELVAEALAAGRDAIEGGDAATASAEFDVVLGIEPDNAAAVAGKARAERLPSVLERMERGRRYEEEGSLPAAIEAYREALALDAAWEPASQALARARTNLEQYEFDALLSKAYAALADRDYRSAIEHFSDALEMRPDSPEAQDGMFQAEEGRRLGEIKLAEVRALAFERRELWPQAIEQYESALETDPTLEYAVTGLARARERQDLDAKIVNIIENPRLLFDDDILAAANELLGEAQSVADPGERIEGQVAQLGRLITLASTPQPVVLESDELTEVTLFRVGTLGTFMSREVQLRPGEYIAVGSRNGFRDVRTRFTVLPGQALEPVRIVCVEPI